jgi:Na+/serine symporter
MMVYDTPAVNHELCNRMGTSEQTGTVSSCLNATILGAGSVQTALMSCLQFLATEGCQPAEIHGRMHTANGNTGHLDERYPK